MIRRPPRSTRTDTLFPYTTLFRSLQLLGGAQDAIDELAAVAARQPQRLAHHPEGDRAGPGLVALAGQPDRPARDLDRAVELAGLQQGIGEPGGEHRHHEPAAQTVGHIECARQRFDALARHPSLDEGEAAVPLRSVLAQQVAALNRPPLRPPEGGQGGRRPPVPSLDDAPGPQTYQWD